MTVLWSHSRTAAGQSLPGAVEDRDWKLQIQVLLTTEKETRAALKAANGLAICLNSRLSLVAPHVVPYPLPLDSPAADLRFTHKRLRDLIEPLDCDVDAEIYLCRDKRDALRQVCSRHAPVLIGVRSTWWPNETSRLVHFLRTQGCKVVLIHV